MYIATHDVTLNFLQSVLRLEKPGDFVKWLSVLLNSDCEELRDIEDMNDVADSILAAEEDILKAQESVLVYVDHTDDDDWGSFSYASLSDGEFASFKVTDDDDFPEQYRKTIYEVVLEGRSGMEECEEEITDSYPELVETVAADD